MKKPIELKILGVLYEGGDKTVDEIAAAIGYDRSGVNKGVVNLRNPKRKAIRVVRYAVVRSKIFRIMPVYGIGGGPDAPRPRFGMPEYEAMRSEHFEMMADVDDDWGEKVGPCMPAIILEADRIFREATRRSVMRRGGVR